MTAKRRRFAEGTSVDVSKSKSELEALLAKHGATQRLFAEDDERERAVIQFRMGERMVRLELSLAPAEPLPEVGKSDWGQTASCPQGWNRWTTDQRKRWVADKREQAAREAWRRILLITKAKLEFIADGLTTFEREFLADIMLPDGRTVHEGLRPGLAEAYLTGNMPPLLPPAGGG